MKKRLILLICCVSLFLSCKKNNPPDDEGGGGDNDLSGKYIIKTTELCPAGTSFFLGYTLSGNLVDHQLTMTQTDTLNSWYLKKLPSGKYLIYARIGNNVLVLKQGAQQTFLIIYNAYGTQLPQYNVIPVTETPAEMQFEITNISTNAYAIKSANGFILTSYKAGKKVGNTVGCSVSGTPLLLNMTQCIERQENADLMQYCFQPMLILQKIN